MKRNITNTVIDPEADQKFQHWQKCLTLATIAEQELRDYMEAQPDEVQGVLFSYSKAKMIPDSEQLKYLAKSEQIAIPYTTQKRYDYKGFIDDLQDRLDIEGLKQNYTFYKQGKGRLVKARDEE